MTPDQLKRVSDVRRLAASGRAREIREEMRVSLRELASVLQKAPSTLSRWESGKQSPPAEDALRWAETLGLPAKRSGRGSS